MGCENTSEISPEVGEVEASKTDVSAKDGATYKAATHGFHKELGSARYNEIDKSVGHNRFHIQSWFDEGITVDTCGYDTAVGAASVTYRIETDTDKWVNRIEPSQEDFDNGSSFGISAFVSFGGLLTAGVQAGVSTPAHQGSTVDWTNYDHCEWNIDLRNEPWPECQDPCPGVQYDLTSDLSAGSGVYLSTKAQFEYRWNCGTGWFYEKTPEVTYVADAYLEE